MRDNKKHMEYQVGYRLTDFVRHNNYISNNLEGNRLFNYTYETATIDVNLNLFNSSYRERFIRPHLHVYCVGLLNKMEFEIFSLIQFNRIKVFLITYKFHFDGAIHSVKVQYELLSKVV
ncbi:hypothetical protein [Pedobacter nyackensis]|uniref:hypothetical protein n=1 Tax=Pedobacter nyackensis TaxID=475255 RepID=UPI002930100B|nr:hypothetical protein [Pedobacter nyackensis]